MLPSEIVKNFNSIHEKVAPATAASKSSADKDFERYLVARNFPIKVLEVLLKDNEEFACDISLISQYGTYIAELSISTSTDEELANGTAL
jgi:hypothetical protein